MIGKATVGLVVLVLLMMIIAARVPSEMAMLLTLAAAIVSFGCFLGFLAWFAQKHPDLAATEGPTYVESRRISLAAKNMPEHSSNVMISDPQNPIDTGKLADLSMSADGRK